AALVRLARRLSIPISRAVTIAEGTADISMWVQLRPVAEGFALAIVDWQRRTSHDPTGTGAALASDPTGWHWEIDAHLCWQNISADADLIDHPLPQVGGLLTAYFQLDTGAQETGFAMPLV